MRRGRIALAVLVPVFILIAGWIASHRAGTLPVAGARERLESRAEEIGRHVEAVVAEARRAAERARDEGPDATASALGPLLSDRLEGAGVVRGGRFDSWSGTPSEAPLFGEPGSLRVITGGIRTSLLVESSADAAGRSGVASFLLETSAGSLRASALLPEPAGGIVARWDFAPGAIPLVPQFDPGPPSSLTKGWGPRGRPPIAAIVLEESSPAALAARARAIARAWAGLAFALLTGWALARRPGPVDARRLAAIVAGVIAARVALLSARSFEGLLPRALGSASLYGRGDVFGLAASPAALFATCAAALILLWAVARAIEGTTVRRASAYLPAAALALAGSAAIVLLAGSLARDARVRVPRLDLTSLGTLLLALSAACLIAGAAELAATVAAAIWSRGLAVPRPGRLAVAVTLFPLSLLFLVPLNRTADRIGDERLRSEFAPLLRDQTARRRMALTASVAESAASPLVEAALARPPGTDDPFLAYDLWIDGDLFHEGFASSLDIYDAGGTRRGHFGFAFPQVGGHRESASRSEAPGAAPIVDLETVPAGASLLRVVHVEAAVAGPSGLSVGRVVGHVLEDPSNLPFLPANAPYVEALAGGPSHSDAPATEAPDYVLFDDEGRVVITTVRQPPAAGAALRAAAAAGKSLEVEAGDTRYHALPLADGGRLHLLLMPAPTVLGALADAVRLLLLSLAVVAFSAVAGSLAGTGGGTSLLDVVRGSFYRKLLAAVLVASVVPLVGLSFFLRAYIDRRGEASLADTAAAVIGAARRVVEDYQSVGEDDPTIPRLAINDQALWWLRRVVGQEIHVYEDGVLAATSKPELFDSALLQKRLPGEVDRDVVRGGQPILVRHERLGTLELPVAYARVDERGGPRDAVIAVPLVIEQRAFARSVDRLVEMLLLLTTALVALLAVSAAWIARSVADPVRRLADASRRIAGGDYGARLPTASRDEVGSLVTDFNRMAGALAAQRADLVRRRDYIEALLRHATTGVVSTDPAGRIVTINPAAEDLLSGTSGSPRHGQLLSDALRESGTLAPLAAALDAPVTSPSTPIEVDLPGPEGLVRIRVVRVPLPDPHGGEPGTLVLLDDVTSLMKSNQLAAWAEMARAIAHEIKNPLTPIQLSAEHVRKLLSDRGLLPVPEIEACLDTIVRNVRELRDISAAFSTYAKIPDLTMTRVDPAAFLADIVRPYRAAPPPHVTIREDHDGAPAILADTRVLARAIVNLIENAIQAMPAGGTLVVASRAGERGDVVLEVSDTGEGLTPEARARLFTPYFSTKSSGTGLGLAIVRRIVAGHGGSIEVDSEAGRGATFRIRLPDPSHR